MQATPLPPALLLTLAATSLLGKMGQKAERRKKSDEGKGGKSRCENVEEEKKRKTRGKGAGVEGVCKAILVSVNICCSACQGSIYQDGLTPGPLLEY